MCNNTHAQLSDGDELTSVTIRTHIFLGGGRTNMCNNTHAQLFDKTIGRISKGHMSCLFWVEEVNQFHNMHSFLLGGRTNICYNTHAHFWGDELTCFTIRTHSILTLLPDSSPRVICHDNIRLYYNMHSHLGGGQTNICYNMHAYFFGGGTN